MMRAHWLVAKEDRLIVIRKYTKFIAVLQEVKRVQ